MPSGSSDPIASQRRLSQLLGDLRRQLSPSVEGMPREVAELVACIHRHGFRPGFNAAEARSRCALRSHSVSSRFRRTMGMGIREYIEWLRMRVAREVLVSEPDVVVFDLALSLGYVHEETFYRAFQRCFGCSPGTWRRERQRAGFSEDAF